MLGSRIKRRPLSLFLPLYLKAMFEGGRLTGKRTDLPSHRFSARAEHWIR